MKKASPPVSLRLVLMITALLLAAATFLLAGQAVERRALFASLRWTGITGLGTLAALLALGVLLASWTAGWDKFVLGFERGIGALSRLRGLNLGLFLLPSLLYAYLVLAPSTGRFLEGLPIRLALFWLVVLAGAALLKAGSAARSWPAAFVASWLLSGAIYKIATFIPEVSTYPFSLSWSETSRYYYASLFFSERIYGMEIPPSALHPSRYLMQAVPFLISGLPLWFHRLWQVLLWLGMGGISVYLLAKRLKIGREVLLPYLAWALLFLFQGPVYYHLLVMPAILFWGFDSRRFWKSLGVVLLASAWAGISRVNWFPAPGLLAAMLYFLEVGFAGGTAMKDEGVGAKRAFLGLLNQPVFLYLLKPLAWFGLGTLSAFVFQAVYILWSGIQQEAFTSSFVSDLLWYRLLPNPTFPLGVLPAVLLVSAPLLGLVIWRMPGLHPFRWFGIGAILLVLFAGGVLVSAKIGGGSNLHNLDAFLVFLLVVGSYVFFGRIDHDRPGPRQESRISWAWLALILIMPVLYNLNAGGPVLLPNPARAGKTLAALTEMVAAVKDRGGEVLFISERHLLTFEMVPRVPLVEKYETVFLMEMAMSGNPAYLESFYEDIREKRYALIITDPLRDTFKGGEYSFGEENDVWVARVTRPLLESYQRAELFKGFGIEVLEPRP